MYAAFVGLSLMLWSGCFGRRSASPEATIEVHAFKSVTPTELLASPRLRRAASHALRQGPQRGSRLALFRRAADEPRVDSTEQSSAEIRANIAGPQAGTSEWRSPR
jgi:hypothetical protein